MKPLEELTNILCKCESVKRDVMELRFGTLINNEKFGICKLYNHANFIYEDKYFLHNLYANGKFEIIGNPIQDHHLRMFCKDKITNHKQICFGREDVSFYKTGIKFATLERYLFIDNYDNTKPLSEQSDETLAKIINLLKGLGKN